MKVIVDATLSVPIKVEIEVPDEDFEDKGTHFAVRDAVLDCATVHVKFGGDERYHARIGNAVVHDWTPA